MRKLESTVDLLEAIREEHDLESDGQIGRLLKVPQQVISSWRTGVRTPGDDHALKIAEALDISPMLVMVIAASERARGKETQRVWKKMAEQIARGVVSSFAILALNAGLPAPVAKAAAPAMYIMSNRKRRFPRATRQPEPV